jgi:hypothetical protein
MFNVASSVKWLLRHLYKLYICHPSLINETLFDELSFIEVVKIYNEIVIT